MIALLYTLGIFAPSFSLPDEHDETATGGDVDNEADLNLPMPLHAALTRDDLEGFTVEIISLGQDGWPHLALLSVGEVLPLSGPHLRLALWPTSTSARNLLRTRRATLAAVAEGTAYRLRLAITARGELVGPAGPLAVFDARVTAVLEDVAAYAVLESGIRFSLVHRAEVLSRWAATRAWLGQLGEPLIE